MINKYEKKKNPIWDELFKDERVSAPILNTLPENIKVAINHERNCIKFRLNQIESYLKRIDLVAGGMNYYDTFKKLKPITGVGFPKEKYLKLRGEWKKENQKKKNDKQKP